MAKAKVKLSLFGLTIPQKIAFARMVVTQSTASGHLPNPTMPTVATFARTWEFDRAPTFWRTWLLAD